MTYKIEVLILPVSDVERALAFYSEHAGFKLDVDYRPSDDFRVVQLTPPGSACSIQIGVGIRHKTPRGDWHGGWEPGLRSRPGRLRQLRRLHRSRRQPVGAAGTRLR
jgi:catechol 2,3-dioxygenase-like lactoylglutathione lyase family enzyme